MTFLSGLFGRNKENSGYSSTQSFEISPKKNTKAEPEKPEDDYLVEIGPLDLSKVKFKKSKNRSERKGEVKYIVLHHTGPGSFWGNVSWLRKRKAKASAHYIIGYKGELVQLVNTHWEAWHAGVAKWNGRRIDNHCSIGIELCNPGVLEKWEDGNYYYERGRTTEQYTGLYEPEPAKIVYPSGKELSGYAAPYPEAQVHKLVSLCKALVNKYPAITRENILTHFEIGFPEGRKNDPFGLDVEYIKDLIFNT